MAYPLLLELYHDYATGMLSREDFVAAVRLVEAYVFRRAICSIPTNSMNKTFATFSRTLKKDRYLESIQVSLLLLPSYRRFPNDEEFRRELQIRDLYNFRSRSYWLRRLENNERKERVQIDEYTIEHIMPQNENLSTAWKTELGLEWKRVHETWLHTLGNLTLTGYNSEYSDRPFTEKRDILGGFEESPLKLNKGLGKLDQWNEDTIKERAGRLAEIALKVWAVPKLANDILEAYKPKAVISGYSIEDHSYLSTGAMHDLFEAFRKEVLALDSCVTEEFLKRYVAYKAEKNIVNVMPKAKFLQLSFNMPFSDVNDPKGLCVHIPNFEGWDKGNVVIGLASLDELPYVMGLVRQSLERQIGNGV